MTPAVDVAKKAKVAYTLHEYTHDPKAPSYGLEAAQLLGVAGARVFKTLMVALEGKGFAIGIVPVEKQLSLKQIAKAAGAKKAVMADKDDVARVSGYVLGGVSPLGQKKQLKTFIDTSALNQETIFVSAGRRGLEIELAPKTLQTLTRAVFAPIAQGD